VTAHPDDPEFAAGGTVARLVREGREVTYAIVTNGNKGSSGRTIPPPLLAEIREEEQRNAARVLGMWSSSANEDGEVEDTRQLRRDVTRQIRRWRPDLIIAQNPSWTSPNFHGWHRDHRITGGASSTASTRLPETTCPSPNSCQSTSRTRCARCT
jgi:LmbE family N-acetylglucosaminyl deacetylase